MAAGCASAGVGKTYAMLEAARARRAEGKDVVIGVVESYGRSALENPGMNAIVGPVLQADEPTRGSRLALCALVAAGTLWHGSLPFVPGFDPYDVEVHVRRAQDLGQLLGGAVGFGQEILRALHGGLGRGDGVLHCHRQARQVVGGRDAARRQQGIQDRQRDVKADRRYRAGQLDQRGDERSVQVI